MWVGGGQSHRVRHNKWSYKTTETRRHRVSLRGPVGSRRSSSLPRAGPPLRPGMAGASGRHGHTRVHPGASRGNRLGHGVSNNWGEVRGGRHRGDGKERGRRPYYGRRPAPGTTSTTLSITKYTDKYKTWRGLVDGECLHLPIFSTHPLTSPPLTPLPRVPRSQTRPGNHHDTTFPT